MPHTVSIIVKGSALAAALAFMGARGYAHMAQTHAAQFANDFCASVQTGEPADRVVSRAEQTPSKSWFATGKHTVSVMFGNEARYVCAIRMQDNKVASKAVTAID